ncbi:hypothetical protein FQN50_002271 [Emmonsiellopsis sp. PD_5]|nr:hypothetical protein FQN50_002271 [Emmonsiellopsis sp. PD_5]
MASSSILSQTLQSITVTKVQELETRRQKYQKQKDEILAKADGAGNDVGERIKLLHDSIKDLGICSAAEAEEFADFCRYVQQSEYDPSVSKEKLAQFEQKIRAKLDSETRKLDLADLYSRLLIEWIDAPRASGGESPSLDNLSLGDSFDVVQSVQKERLEQLRDKFESVVLTPLETDEVEIDNYLKQLFNSDEGESALESLRKQVRGKGTSMLRERKLFDRDSLEWCIQSLLKVDLFDDEKKATLRDFLSNEDVLSEIKDVLNMRYANIENWSWGLGDRGMPVVPRQSPNGKWRVMMDDDVLHTIFTHWIGTIWAVELKGYLQGMQKNPSVWKGSSMAMPPEELAKRKYYLGSSFSSYNTNVDALRQESYRDHFFLAPLPSKLYQSTGGGYDDDDDEDDEEELNLSPKQIKQLLLRTLATEVLVRRSIDGEAAVVQSDFQWFSTGLAHSTIFAVLRFMGFQEEWITFFKKVLEPPLDMLNGKPVRTRKRGLPMAHIFEKFIGEVIMFFMDLAVNHESGMILYRFHDDLWLSGKPAECAKAWNTMETFAKVMGLEFNMNKTGSVYFVEEERKRKPEIARALPKGPVVMNFMVLDPESGHWVINKEHVMQHVAQLQKQLAGCKSVLEWTKTWNSCIGRFFSYTFADPANCFGLSHVTKTLEAHKQIQSYLFSNSTVAQHLSQTISTRFDVESVSDAFLYMPETCGGLGLLNPFIPLLFIRDGVCVNPDDYLRQFHKDERKEYEELKKTFENLSDSQRRRRYKDNFYSGDGNGSYSGVPERHLPWGSSAQSFMSFDDYVRWRECASSLFHSTYKYLMTPAKKTFDVTFSDHVYNALEDLSDEINGTTSGASRRGRGGRRSGRVTRTREYRGGLPDVDPDSISDENGWIVSFYADEVIAQFGGLGMLDTSLLPLGVLKAMRSKMITWQMVL